MTTLTKKGEAEGEGRAPPRTPALCEACGGTANHLSMGDYFCVSAAYEREKTELANLKADHAVRRQAVLIERSLRIAAFERLARIEEALTECGYTDRQARCAAIDIISEQPAAGPSKAVPEAPHGK